MALSLLPTGENCFGAFSDSATEAGGAMNMRSANRASYIQITFTAIGVFTMMIRIAHTDELETKQKALNLISDAADRICQKIPLEGQKAEISSVVKQITDLGISGKTSAYQGILQDELASSIKTGNECRVSVLEKLKDIILSPSDHRSDLSKPNFSLIADDSKGLLLINRGGEANNIDYFDGMTLAD